MSAAAPSDQDILQLVYRHARRFGLCREDAQDCAQEFLVRLIGQQNPHRESIAWLNRCAQNFASNFHRGLQRRQATERRAVESAQNHGSRSGLSPAIQPGPKTLVMQRDFCAQVRSLLILFTKEQQDLFVRYHLRHQDLAHVALRHGRSVHALQQSLYSMHRRLARLLLEQGWSAGDVKQLFVPKPTPPARHVQACEL